MVCRLLNTLRSSAALFLALVAFSLPAGTGAQAPPGPLPGTPSRDPAARVAAKPPDAPRTKNLTGTWTLNADDSDDPRKKLQQARGAGHGQGGGRSPGGMGGGWPGGHGGYGGRHGGESNDERQKMQIFLQPAQKLTIAQKEPEIDITDDAERKFTAFTDGRKVEKSKDPERQQFDAKWDEYRLVMEGKDPRGDKYERSYEVLEGNQQLRETLFLKIGRNQTEISIRYVYDLVSTGRKP